MNTLSIEGVDDQLAEIRMQLRNLSRLYDALAHKVAELEREKGGGFFDD